jgi:hypothetical protein
MRIALLLLLLLLGWRLRSFCTTTYDFIHEEEERQMDWLTVAVRVC